MGERINLIKDEKTLYDRLISIISKIRGNTDMMQHRGSSIEIEELYREIAFKAHKLHMSLKERGIEPRHYKYMIANRGVPMDDIAFYKHIHPVEDLIAFISNSSVNDDPEDKTIGKEFKFSIFTRRWGHDDRYSLRRTGNGWYLRGPATFNSGECDKKGYPFLYKTMEHDMVSYPYNMGDLLEYLWEKASEGLTEEEVQKAFNDIVRWIKSCEETVPRGVFEGLL